MTDEVRLTPLTRIEVEALGLTWLARRYQDAITEEEVHAEIFNRNQNTRARFQRKVVAAFNPEIPVQSGYRTEIPPEVEARSRRIQEARHNPEGRRGKVELVAEYEVPLNPEGERCEAVDSVGRCVLPAGHTEQHDHGVNPEGEQGLSRQQREDRDAWWRGSGARMPEGEQG